MKPYQQVPIVECHEPLLPISSEFAIETPHPYVRLGAPYGEKSPYYLRQTVLERLLQAQDELQQSCPGWRIQIFDAYRPLIVQQYMVDYTFAETVAVMVADMVADMAADKGISSEQLTDEQRQNVWAQVYQFWAVPSSDPRMPPPHSTGAAVDVTLVNAEGLAIDMGSPIDEMSPRSHPNYFAKAANSHEVSDSAIFHAHRQILKCAMTSAGFQQHPNEWWHFSWGDQLWAWLVNQQQDGMAETARYGSI
ncbi:MAG: M15 family metallopeptidase [Drouetiella hepatica Uher 2000/2452]|jgi:D-alanyl-D-alanine dipeptidase|uniref:D-alanyl-D-alanine dipeptidase n=1 Tax=Drouetiella hepatica Uher 2000/2452 TaxID=904376 RepID=A0A951UN49_9CYAN|nr:M15 family metallopeptidase [Drouetiella hepatica Uher 2000/2452]